MSDLMGWLRRILRGGDERAAVDPDAEAFDAQWVRERHRFGIVTGVGVREWTLTHPDTGEEILPHEGLNATFEDWREAASYNRRKLLFDLMAEFLDRAFKPWQRANYLTTVRSPDEALQQLEAEYGPVPGEQGPEVAFAFSYALTGLTRYEDALPWAQLAVQERPDRRSKVAYADALHLCDRRDEAHAIYDELMAHLEPTGLAADNMFLDMFALESGAIPSPVFAVESIQTIESAVRNEVLELLEPEFYWNPYFCMHHAYALAAAGDTIACLAKLLGVATDMPWVKEANLNALSIIRQLDPDNTDLADELAMLESNIAANGWTTDGMHKFSIEP